MILTTGGRAIGATSTRSSPRSSAAASASSTAITPNCSPPGPITRTGLMRICRLTRTRFSRSFVDSGRTSFCETKKGTSRTPDVPATPTRAEGSAAGLKPGPGHAARSERGLRVGEFRSPLARRELYLPRPGVSTRLGHCRRRHVTQVQGLYPLLHPGHGDPRIVPENEEPVARHRVSEQRPLALECPQRL